MKTKVIFVAFTLAAILFGLTALKAAEPIDLPLQQMHQDVLASTRVNTSVNGQSVTQFRNIPAADAQTTAARFKAILLTEDFGATSGGATRVRMCADVAQRLLPALADIPPDPSGQNLQVLAAVEAFLGKVSDSIDPNWQFQPVSANITPPAGVPNAAAGMNPDAINDPQKRQAYLDGIAAEQSKQLKNSQQTELRNARDGVLSLVTGLMVPEGKNGWTIEELYKHFAKDDQSRAILTSHLKRTGKLR